MNANQIYVKDLLEKFRNGSMDIETLRVELLNLNPHTSDSIEYVWFCEAIEDQISEIKENPESESTKAYLSETSSGSIIEFFEDYHE